MSYLTMLLNSKAPLTLTERADLQEWRFSLNDDMEFFGPTPEDEARVAAITKRLDGQNE